jgi:ATP-dependent DNA ligase
MDLPLLPPVKPMLAKAVTKLPTAEGMYYEPKWDGFRCIVFRDGDEVELGSRNERPLTRYFPEVVEAVKAALPERCVVDGEIVVPQGRPAALRGLLQRIHPHSRASTCSPSRRRRPSSPSTCSPSATSRWWRCRSPSARAGCARS